MQFHISSLPSQVYPCFSVGSIPSCPRHTELKSSVMQLYLKLFRWCRTLFFWALATTYFETSYSVSSADVNIIPEQNTEQLANFSYTKK